MKTGHERNYESLNRLFNSKQNIKSGIEFSPVPGYLKHDILNICNYDRIVDTEDYDEASKRLARYLNPFNYGLDTRDELIKAIKRILIKEGGSSFDKDDYVRHAYAGDIQSSRRPIKSGYDENEISNLISKYTNELKSCTTGKEVQKVVHDFYYDENVSKYVASIRTRSGKPINSFFTTKNPLEIEYTTDWDVGVRKCKVQNLYKLIRFELKPPYGVHSSRKPIKSSNVIKERDLGYNDYFKGYKKSDNPYLKDEEPVQYNEWETGWLMAEKDDIDQTNYAKYGSHFYTN